MPSPTTWTLTSSYLPTANADLNGLLGGIKWGGLVGEAAVLTYSFPQVGSYWSTDPVFGYGPKTNDAEPWNPSFGGATSDEQAMIKTALRTWSSAATISFAEVADDQNTAGDMRFASTSAPTAHAYFPDGSATAGDVWFGPSLDHLGTRGSYAYATVLHEIGHVIGLKHPHEVDGGFNAMPAAKDAMEFSILSYRSYVGASTTGGYSNETWGYAQSPMMHDIAALQYLYGANFSTNSGNTVYKWSPSTGQAFINGIGQGTPGGNRVLETVWDGGGIDTYDLSNYASNLTIDLRPGESSTLSPVQLANLGNGQYAKGNIYNALQHQGDTRSLIENAVAGSGNNTMIGNQGTNSLSGGSGGDRLYGFQGNDSLNGGAGDDWLYGSSGADTLWGGLGADTFIFNTALNAVTNVDVIRDFSVPGDTIRLENSVFTSLTKTGSLAANAFEVGATADDLLDRIIYDPAIGALSYDPDGSGSRAAVKFAQLTAGLSISHADFYVV